MLGAAGGAADLLEEVLDFATVGLCAEMLGAMAQAFDLTLAHLKSRQQFGVPIGSFQALKHRAAQMFIEVELERSAMMAAARAADAGTPDARALVSLAKARCSDAGMLVANEGVQMFGGRLPSVLASAMPSAVACASFTAACSSALGLSGSTTLASAGAGAFFCDLSWSKR